MMMIAVVIAALLALVKISRMSVDLELVVWEMLEVGKGQETGFEIVRGDPNTHVSQGDEQSFCFFSMEHAFGELQFQIGMLNVHVLQGRIQHLFHFFAESNESYIQCKPCHGRRLPRAPLDIGRADDQLAGGDA